MLCGFGIRSKGVCFFFCWGWGITNPPVLIGRTFFLRRISNPPGRLAGLRLPFQAGTPSGLAFATPSRNAWRGCVCHSKPGRLAGLRLLLQAGTPSGLAFATPSRDAWRGWVPEKIRHKKYGTKKGLTLFTEKSVLVYLQMISKTYILERN